jgi:hypothetical protein
MRRNFAAAFLLIAMAVGPFFPGSRIWAAESSPTTNDAYASFRTRVLVIDKAMGNDFFGTILGYDVLRAYRPFNDLASHASDQIDACIDFISNAHPTLQQIHIAILSMHQLKVHDYVRFARKIVDLYDRRLIIYPELVSVIFPDQSWSTVIAENYNDPEIRTLLENIAARPDVEANAKSEIADILSGNAWEDLQEFRANCCTNPPAPAPIGSDGKPLPPLTVPREFKSLTRLFKFDEFKSATDRQAWISAVLKTNSPDRNMIARRFLTELLATKATDAELEWLWQIWNPDFKVTRPGAMRGFLAQIRDAIPSS